MTLRELFESDEGGDLPADLPWMVVEISEDDLRNRGLLFESEWRPSRVKGIWYRVDAAQPDLKLRRHVHVADKKHISAPKKQASWNDEMERHDRKTFNVKLGARRSYRDVARDALGLPADAVLEHQLLPDMRRLLLESSAEATDATYECYRYIPGTASRSRIGSIFGAVTGSASKTP